MKMDLKLLKRMKVLTAVIAMAAAGICFSCQAERQSIPLLESSQTAESAVLEETSQPAPSQTAEALEESLPAPGIYVHVCGQVVSPGVYEMEPGSRVYEALELAGGPSENGAPDYLNLAMEVQDGMKIQVPSAEEAARWKASGISGITEEGVLLSSGENAKVNLNTADKEELMTLPGIGESRAEDIIRYRQENGPFQQIQDIMNISGIKEAAFQKLKDSITV